MHSQRNFNLFSKALSCITVLLLMITACLAGELSETEAFFSFIRAVDPQNVLKISWNGILPHPCSHQWRGVECNPQATTVTEIRLENSSLRGIIDAESLCELPNLQVLSLARNLIQGTIPHSILNCRKLTQLNLSSNLLTGTMPAALVELKDLRTLDISNNHFTGTIPSVENELKQLDEYWSKEGAARMYKFRKLAAASANPPTNDVFEGSPNKFPDAAPSPLGKVSGNNDLFPEILNVLLIVVGIGFFFCFFLATVIVSKRVPTLAKEKEILETQAQSPQRIPPPQLPVEAKPEDGHSELVFFVEEQERFKLDDLYDATADLRSQTYCSSLYQVVLKNNAVYAVKRLKKLHAPFEEFGRIMRKIGDLKHPNILPLVGYNSNNEEKLVIYKYQSNGSLLMLLEDYIDGKKEFPWRLRLSIASGIARGLDFIYQNPDYQEIIPHGNLKLSNILLDENSEPLISEYGLSRFVDPKRACFVSFNGCTAPEKTLSEQGDVYSFGIILLELLTGKTVEKTGVDLPSWVRAMVREEWTGEVFDKEAASSPREFAFPLLNIALKCVSHSPEDRPTMAEVMEKMEEVLVAIAHDDASIAHDWSLLHSVIPETWDTPASNY